MAGGEPQDGAGARFGKFLLLKKLASGGMGEIFLAKQTGLVGFEKILVIKRILQHHLDNKQYVDMFFSEARIAAMLSHSNVIQVYDMGEVDEHFYIAMEYVHGRSLKEVLTRSNRNNNPIPLAYIAEIASQACAGLSYSHNLDDAAHQPLNVIHRHINPHNLLISYHGEVKIIDFGIAKSTMQVSKTEAGTIKGKFIYMSPEQSAAEPLDKRSDIFSLSIVLYELLAGTNPFQRDNIVLSLEAIQRRDPVPITEVREDSGAFLPKWLEELFSDRIEEDRQILLETGSGISAMGRAGKSGLGNAESTEAISIAGSEAEQSASAGLGPSEPTAGLDQEKVSEAINDVFADRTPREVEASVDAEDDVFSTSQADAKVLEEFDDGFSDEKTRRMIPTDEATRHDRGPRLGAIDDEVTRGIEAAASAPTAAFMVPVADREETKEYEQPAKPMQPTTDLGAIDLGAVDLSPPRRNLVPVVAGAGLLIFIIIALAILIGRGGEEAGADAGADAAAIAEVATDASGATDTATAVAIGDRTDAAKDPITPPAIDASAQPVGSGDGAVVSPEGQDAAAPPDATKAPTELDAGKAAVATVDASTRRRPDASARRRSDAGGPPVKPPPRKRFGSVIINPGIGNTVTLGGRGGVGTRTFQLGNERGRFIVSSDKLRVQIDFRVVGEVLRLRVDSKPWSILSDAGLSRGRTPQTVGGKRRFSLEFKSPRLPAPMKVIVIYRPSG